MDYKHTSPKPTTSTRQRVFIATARIPTAGTQTATFSSRTLAEDWLMGQLSRTGGRLEVHIETLIIDDKVKS